MSSSKLKIIACISMFIDHIGAVLFPNLIILRMIGRIAFPIFAFLIARGYFYTKNVNKYLIRLLIFAFISEMPFDLVFSGKIINFNSQNVFFTLFLGLLAINIYEKNRHKYSLESSNRKRSIEQFFWMACIILIGILAILLKTDYNMFGILIIFAFHIYRDNFKRLYLVFLMITLLMFSTIQIFAVLALPIIYYYNGKKGKNIKYIFYAFYPVHLLLIHSIKMIIVY